jgi:anti-sigma factor RsiW
MNSSEPSLTCEQTSWQLFDLRDGCLSAEETAALMAHLEACPGCREERAWDDRLRGLLRELPLPRTSLGEAVRRRVRQRRRWRVGAGAAAAALLAAGLVAWQTWPRTPPESVAVRPNPPPPPRAANDLPESPVLFAAPPVDSLDLLARQQAVTVAALRQLEKE